MYDKRGWIKLRRSGISTVEIARRNHVSGWKVYQYFKSNGFRQPDVEVGRKLTKVEKVFIAAVLDCEGSMGARQNFNRFGEYTQIIYHVRVEMTNDKIPLRLLKLCGGNFLSYKEKSGNRKPQCMWIATPKTLRWLLPSIRNFFMIKQRHADILIELLNGRRRGIRNPSFNKRSNELLRELTSLNIKGRRSIVRKLPEK